MQSLDTVIVIKVHRLEWLEHVARMDSTRKVRKLVYGRPGRWRKKGRPSLQWPDDTGLDLRNIQ